MKHLKIYENYEVQVWVVPLKMPDFIICLNKIGVKDIDRWVQLHRYNVFTDGKKYPTRKTITMRKDIGRGNGFTWHEYPTSKSSDYTQFMGKLECTPEEIQEYYDNIEMEKRSKKYNL